jgi:hypothetical protein
MDLDFQPIIIHTSGAAGPRTAVFLEAICNQIRSSKSTPPKNPHAYLSGSYQPVSPLPPSLTAPALPFPPPSSSFARGYSAPYARLRLLPRLCSQTGLQSLGLQQRQVSQENLLMAVAPGRPVWLAKGESARWSC